LRRVKVEKGRKVKVKNASRKVKVEKGKESEGGQG
jgi:hypothetical protein